MGFRVKVWHTCLKRTCSIKNKALAVLPYLHFQKILELWCYILRSTHMRRLRTCFLMHRWRSGLMWGLTVWLTALCFAFACFISTFVSRQLWKSIVLFSLTECTFGFWGWHLSFWSTVNQHYTGENFCPPGAVSALNSAKWSILHNTILRLVYTSCF